MQTLAVMPRPGDVVGGRYRIEVVVGNGGFGTVYRATQENLGRAVALKLLHPGLFAAEGAHERFVREAELAQQLKHPNTVRVYDFGRTDTGLPFIVWEYLEGQPLDALIAREGPQPPARVQRITVQVLKALMEAHQLGIVHRDIKPSNLFVSNFSGEPDFVKVLDFGIAKSVSEQGPQITSGALPVGTPSYMAPEQVRNEGVGPWTDLYALGLVMAEMLFGRPIVQGKALVDVFMQQASVEPLSLPAEVVHSPLGAVIQRATHKTPSARYTSAGEMLADLERARSSSAGSWASASHAPTLPAGAPGAPLTPSVSVTAPTPHTPNLVTALPAPSPKRSLLWVWVLVAMFLSIGGVALVGVGGAAYVWRSQEPEASGEKARAVNLQGIGAETVRARIAPLGWTVPGDPILNLEGTHQMHLVAIGKGEQSGMVTIYDYLDASGAAGEARRLEAQGLAVALDGDILLSVEVRGEPAEAKKLLAAITRP